LDFSDLLDMDMYLYQLAATLGVTVVLSFVGLRPGWWGGYDHLRRRIHIRPGLHPVQATYALAHELGHAIHGHELTGEDPLQEVEARHFAARLMVNARKLAALRACGLPDKAIARAMNLPEEALRDYDAYVAPAAPSGPPTVLLEAVAAA
jgi:Zn-dependent peptidase ImmA (M78 family)